ncbi:MAG: hypothetical protein H7X70_04615 [Candidatus Kapabacteria bacterium]|nr:hypothetical protein [Candidatus Kapabacteria bacterium]
MRPDLQRSFIDKVSDESYARFKSELNKSLGVEIAFRVCEMPIFVSHDFRKVLESSAIEIIQQCVRPEYLAQSESTLTPGTTARNQNDRPLFSVVDFAVCADDNGNWQPKLIELQGFPSLLGYQYLYASRLRESYELLDTTPFLHELDRDSYLDLLRTSIYAGYNPSDVALVEVDPLTQKTRPDFIALEQLIGLQTINIRDIAKVGKGLFFRDSDGNQQQLKRIFNRAIVDELDDMNVHLNFSWSDDLDVEWAGHPNWYFRISKFALPYLDHPAAPKTWFLHELQHIPEDLHRYVLKPLYSFAGKGVNVNPTRADIESIPTEQRDGWVLQEKVVYAECIETPHGMNKVEIRIMLIWPDGNDAPIPVMSLARTGRGQLMGARYNVEPWTGSTGCLFV